MDAISTSAPHQETRLRPSICGGHHVVRPTMRLPSKAVNLSLAFTDNAPAHSPSPYLDT